MSATDIDRPTTGPPGNPTLEHGYRAPASDTERRFVEVLVAGVVGAAQVSVDSNFFDDLDADTMVMAQFCARVRKQPDLPSVSMKDVYRHSTVAALVAALTAVTAAPGATVSAVAVSGADGDLERDESQSVASLGSESAEPASAEVGSVGSELAEPPALGRPRYALCGALQLLVLFGLSVLAAFVMAQGYEWVYRRSGVIGPRCGRAPVVATRFGFSCARPCSAPRCWVCICGRCCSWSQVLWGCVRCRSWRSGY